MSERDLEAKAREIVDRRLWPDIEINPMVRRAYDVALDCVMDALRGGPRINPFPDVQRGKSLMQMRPEDWLEDTFGRESELRQGFYEDDME